MGIGTGTWRDSKKTNRATKLWQTMILKGHSTQKNDLGITLDIYVLERDQI